MVALRPIVPAKEMIANRVAKGANNGLGNEHVEGVSSPPPIWNHGASEPKITTAAPNVP